MSAASATARLHGLPPIVSERTRLLILGSFPGTASLRVRQYYAHPHNQFWKILQAIWPELPQGPDYASRCRWLLERGLGLWDVYASCERTGSLDSAIRNAVVNDFAVLKGHCPQLRLIVHNGGESFKHAQRVRDSLLGDPGPPPADGGAAHEAAGAGTPPLVKLPSTSPANASWSFARKLEAWRDAMTQAGLR